MKLNLDIKTPENINAHALHSYKDLWELTWFFEPASSEEIFEIVETCKFKISLPISNRENQAIPVNKINMSTFSEEGEISKHHITLETPYELNQEEAASIINTSGQNEDVIILIRNTLKELKRASHSGELQKYMDASARVSVEKRVLLGGHTTVSVDGATPTEFVCDCFTAEPDDIALDATTARFSRNALSTSKLLNDNTLLIADSGGTLRTLVFVDKK